MYHLFKGTDVRDRSVFDLQSHFGKLRQRAAEYAAANGKAHNIRQIIKVDERRQRAVRQTAQRLNKAVKIKRIVSLRVNGYHFKQQRARRAEICKNDLRKRFCAQFIFGGADGNVDKACLAVIKNSSDPLNAEGGKTVFIKPKQPEQILAEKTMQLIYQMDITDEFDYTRLSPVDEDAKILDKAQALATLNAVKDHRDEIDEVIRACLDKWSFSRVARTDLAILRTALAEMMYVDSIPSSVSINEAVKLSKKYSDEKSYAFVNSVLSKADKYLARREQD